MRIGLLVSAAALSLALAVPASAGAVSVAPGHVLVRFDESTTRSQRIAVEKATGTGLAIPLPSGARQLEIKDGESVGATLAELRAQPVVRYALPDYRIHAAA